MNDEEKKNQTIESIRLDLIAAVGINPVPPREVPREIRQRVVAFLAEHNVPKEISRAIGINPSNFFQWKKEFAAVGRLEEVRVTHSDPVTSPKILISDGKKHITIEGLEFREILLLLKERIL